MNGKDHKGGNMSEELVPRIRLALILLGIVSGWMIVLFAEPFRIGSRAQGVMQSVIFRQGENGYTGCADTRISAENPYSNFGDAELILGGKGRVNIVIRFDVSSLPSNAIIHEATLSLKVVNYGQRPSDPVIMGIFAVTRAWEEMEATWYKATNADDWGLPGCNDVYSDRSADALDSQAIFELGWYSWDITSAAQHWVQDHASNKGVVIQQTNLEVGGEYDIRESEYNGQYVRPLLTVKYFLATPTPPVTNTPTASPTATPLSTATATQTATPTGIPTHTPTEIPTTTPTRLPIVHRLYFPKVRKMCEQQHHPPVDRAIHRPLPTVVAQ